MKVYVDQIEFYYDMLLRDINKARAERNEVESITSVCRKLHCDGALPKARARAKAWGLSDEKGRINIKHLKAICEYYDLNYKNYICSIQQTTIGAVKTKKQSPKKVTENKQTDITFRFKELLLPEYQIAMDCSAVTDYLKEVSDKLDKLIELTELLNRRWE